MKNIKSAILWSGPSLIDGKEIILIGVKGSSNRKTGAMLQTYILLRDIDPITANRTGADYSICGNCPLKGQADQSKTSGNAPGRACYVNLGQGPLTVYKRFQRGGYPIVQQDQLEEYAQGYMLRMGTYGDPLAVPASVWAALRKGSLGWTAYTHQHEQAVETGASAYAMHSADTLEQAKAHWYEGRRTFRVIPIGAAAPKNKHEIECPSSKGIQCIKCKLCNGSDTKAKSIYIYAHGATKGNIK